MNNRHTAKTLPCFIIAILLIAALYTPHAKADCSGCLAVVTIIPAIYASADFVTAGAPALLIENNQHYSYGSTYMWGLGVSLASILTAVYFETSEYATTQQDHAMLAGAAGLLAGNYIGYKRSLRTEKQHFAIQFKDHQPILAYTLSF